MKYDDETLKFMKTAEDELPIECNLYFKGIWLIRTTPTGVEVNQPIPWLSKLYAMVRYGIPYYYRKYILAYVH
jgi:hypothetical protein